MSEKLLTHEGALKKLGQAQIKIANHQNTIKNLQGFNAVLQGCIEKIVSTANEVVQELNGATDHLPQDGE